MWNSAQLKPDRVIMSGTFYCPYDPATGHICLTIKATSLPQATQRMAALAQIIDVKPAGDLPYVVLDEAPHGVPCYFDGVIAVAPDHDRVSWNG